VTHVKAWLAMARAALGTVILVVAIAAALSSAMAVESPDAKGSSGGPGAPPDPIVSAIERYAGEDAEYWRRVDAYLEAQRNGAQLSAEQVRRASNAYVYYGYVFVRRGDARSAAERFGQAIAVDETNPLAAYCLGVLHKQYHHFEQAVANLRAAGKLGGPLKPDCRRQLNEIVQWFSDQAAALTERGQYIDAAACYRFLAEQFSGDIRTTAQQQLKAVQDEVQAERLLVEARQKIHLGQTADGRRLLKELMTSYSWTRAAETAKKIYRGNGSLEVKVKSESPAGKYAAREKWIDLETANCIVYYKTTEQAKQVAKRVEDTLARVTAQLEYTGLDWHRDKCKVFVFDDAAAWDEFVKESGATTEWADGFAYGPLREIYVHAGDGERMLDTVLPHELTHVIHREYAREDTPLPLWLLEGLACANEFTGKDQRFGLARSALATGKFIPLSHLTAFRSYPRGEAVALFYAESLALVEFILDRFGHEGLAQLHKKLRGTEDFDKLVKRAFKIEPDAFEREWLEYVRTAKPGAAGGP
jgi:tetratricopeptide (TPR) repeat protein